PRAATRWESCSHVPTRETTSSLSPATASVDCGMTRRKNRQKNLLPRPPKVTNEHGSRQTREEVSAEDLFQAGAPAPRLHRLLVGGEAVVPRGDRDRDRHARGVPPRVPRDPVDG